MTVCPHTSLTIPECCCARCVERQLAEFAPRSGPRGMDESADRDAGDEAAFAPEHKAVA